MDLYIPMVNGEVQNIRYQCICCQTANVDVGILCSLAKGKSLDDVAGITEDDGPRLSET